MDHARIVDAVRPALEAAGAPAYAVALVGARGLVRAASGVHRRPGPAHEQARRLTRGDVRAVVVGFEARGSRAAVTVLDPAGRVALAVA
ncbi:MAG: hypothetical protein HZB46_02085 [Solirubrobacterales bacterium]|nr:hypothetical protein [Solirubrobacterales bacterium]